MASKYSVIQYAPNPITGERINIGVIAFDNDIAHVSFISNWKRVKAFAGMDVTFLKELAQEFEALASGQLALPSLEQGPQLNEKLIAEITTKWANSVTLTSPRASLQSLDDVLSAASSQFLTQPRARQRAYRDRRSAVGIATDSLRHALELRAGPEQATKWLHRERELKGKYGPHIFDVVIANGSPRVAVQGVSFELPEARQLDQFVDAVAFQVFDTRQASDDLQIGILALPPVAKSHQRAKSIYDRAIKTYTGLEAHVIEEHDAESWAYEQIEKIPL